MAFEHRRIATRALRGRTLFELAEGFENRPYACLLESAGMPSPISRYSFFCVDPFWVFTSKRRTCFAGPPGDLRRLEGDPFVELDALLKRFRAPSAWAPGLPPFLGGAVGYLGYELLYLIEDIPDLGRDDHPVADCQLFFYDTVFTWDAVTRTMSCISNGFGGSEEEATRNAERRVTEMWERAESSSRSGRRNVALFEHGARKLSTRPRLTDEAIAEAQLTPVMTHAEYVDVVEQARSEIFAGNVFEICTTNRFDTVYEGTGLELYRTLRSINHAPFGSYLRLDGVEVVSSSPERFLRLDRDRYAETRPMKGTRPRGKTPEEDEGHRRELATDKKSAAENMMIVDLARSDLGRVCEFRTVEVPELRIVESYPFTHQLVSTIRGKLSPGLDNVDLLRAMFPGGSMTGAPKIEALKILDRLEPVKRGIYSGSIGYIDFDGAMDLNIVIRTFIKKGTHLSFHVGGAVVAGSDPEDEYQETLDKAHALVSALEITRERTGG